MNDANTSSNSNDNKPSNSNDNRPLATSPLSVMSTLSNVPEKLVTAVRKLNDCTTSLCLHRVCIIVVATSSNADGDGDDDDDDDNDDDDNDELHREPCHIRCKPSW